MKVRTDFVTNSSSSSFILSFKNEDSIYDTLKNQFSQNINLRWPVRDIYLKQLYEEIKDSDRLSKDDLKEIIEDEWLWYRDLDRMFNYEYSKVNEFIKSDAGEQFKNEKNEEYLNEVLSKIGDNEIIVQVEHGDEGEGENGVLERDILPYLDCTAISFSHH